MYVKCTYSLKTNDVNVECLSLFKNHSATKIRLQLKVRNAFTMSPTKEELLQEIEGSMYIDNV